MKNIEKFNFSIINEGATKIYIHNIDKNAVPSKSMTVFYNSRMEINRDITNLSILVYNKLFNKNSLGIVDPMAASGVSSIRILKECRNIKRIFIRISDTNKCSSPISFKFSYVFSSCIQNTLC